MNTLILFNGSFPNGYAATEHVRKLAEGLSQYSDVTVLIPHSAEHMHSLQSKGILNGAVFYFALQSDRWTNRCIKDRLFYQGHRVMQTLKYVWKHAAQYDALYFYGIDIPVFLRIMIALAAKHKGCAIVQEYTEKPFVFHKHEPLFQFLEWHFLVPLIDGFVVISDALRELLSHYTQGPFLKIPILVNDDDFIDLQRKSPSPLNCRYIIHVGTLTEKKDNILVFLQAFALLTKKYSEVVNLVLTFPLEKSPQYRELQNIIRNEHLQERVICTGYLSDAELCCYLTNAELAVIAKQNNEQNRYCFPTKLGQYLIHGVPTVISSVGEMGKYMTEGKDAYIVTDLSAENICQKMFEVLNDPDRVQVGKNGQDTAKREFSCKKIGKSLFDFIQNMVLPKVL